MEDPRDLTKSRTHGAIENERMQLLIILAHYWQELERNEIDGGSQKLKSDLWQTITNEFNNHPTVKITRTQLQVKTLFKNMKTKAKKYSVKISRSQEDGIIAEADPISEIVLKLHDLDENSVNPVLEYLKSQYVNDGTSELGEYLPGLPDLNEDVEDEEISQIKEENFDIDGPRDEADSPLLSSPQVLVPIVSLESPSEVHTFGDLSVTPIITEKNDKTPPISIRKFSDAVLPLNNHSFNSKSPSNSLKRPANEMNNGVNFTNKNFPPEKLNKLDTNYPSNRARSFTPLISGNCCCPESHVQMVNMAAKEHEMRMSILSEELLNAKEERKLKQNQRKIQDAELLIRQDTIKANYAEHKSRLKLIELECKILEEKAKHNNNRSNKWFYGSNGSKEI